MLVIDEDGDFMYLIKESPVDYDLWYKLFFHEYTYRKLRTRTKHKFYSDYRTTTIVMVYE